MINLEEIKLDSKYGSIRPISHSDINLLMSDLIDEDKKSAEINGYSSHIEMIANTILRSEVGYSIIDPDGLFCSAFGVAKLDANNHRGMLWMLSCNNFKRHYNNLVLSKTLLDFSKIVLDQMSEAFDELLCLVEKNNFVAKRRTVLMGFKKNRSLPNVDEYVRK